MDDKKIIPFTPRKPVAQEDRQIWACACGNAQRFRLFEDGDVQCRDCGSVSDRCRVYDPTEKR